ncbi:MAG TPA: hypothetical protein VGE52_20095, partial [Pirellulales bacterium]
MSASSPDSQPAPVSPTPESSAPAESAPSEAVAHSAAAATPDSSAAGHPPAAPPISSALVDPQHGHGDGHPTHYWLWVMCLTGVDYFSTLAYQPSIAFSATGRLMPLATLVLVAVTLFGALPIYRYVMRESPHGQGSIAMLERLVSGWSGKFLVLVLLGFAVTDFVITKTLSAADAAEHLVHNPNWPWPVSTWEEEQGDDAEGLLPEVDKALEEARPDSANPPPSAHATAHKRGEPHAGAVEPSYW